MKKRAVCTLLSAAALLMGMWATPVSAAAATTGDDWREGTGFTRGTVDDTFALQAPKGTDCDSDYIGSVDLTEGFVWSYDISVPGEGIALNTFKIESGNPDDTTYTCLFARVKYYVEEQSWEFQPGFYTKSNDQWHNNMTMTGTKGKIGEKAPCSMKAGDKATVTLRVDPAKATVHFSISKGNELLIDGDVSDASMTVDNFYKSLYAIRLGTEKETSAISLSNIQVSNELTTPTKSDETTAANSNTDSVTTRTPNVATGAGAPVGAALTAGIATLAVLLLRRRGQR